MVGGYNLDEAFSLASTLFPRPKYLVSGSGGHLTITNISEKIKFVIVRISLGDRRILLQEGITREDSRAACFLAEDYRRTFGAEFKVSSPDEGGLERLTKPINFIP